MAAASHYRSDYTAVLRTAYAALARAYGLAAVPSEAEAETRTAEMYQAGITAAGVTAALALPGLSDLTHACDIARFPARADPRSEEHPSELQSLMRNSYAVFCLKKKTT